MSAVIAAALLVINAHHAKVTATLATIANLEPLTGVAAASTVVRIGEGVPTTAATAGVE